MRSMTQILWLVLDKEINTPAEGAALLDEEAKHYAEVLKIPEAQARAELQENIEDAAQLCLRSDAKRLREIYGSRTGRMPVPRA